MSFLCCLLSQPASLGRNEITLIKFIEDKFVVKASRFHAFMIWIYRLRRLLAIIIALVFVFGVVGSAFLNYDAEICRAHFTAFE